MKIDDLKKAAFPICQKFDVYRLEAFGSVACGSASLSSDVDLLVEFNQPEERLAKRFFGLLHGLEDVLGCKVDLLTQGSLSNPYFKARVMNEKVAVYER